jgi:lysozyme family protein
MILEVQRHVGALKKYKFLLLGVLAIIVYYVSRKRQNMIFSKEFEDYILSVEGGKSSNQKDPAKKCHAGVHTNKGITYCSWDFVQKQLGRTSDYDRFLNMSHEDWQECMNVLFLENAKFGNIAKLGDKYPVLAMFCIDWAFNHGSGGFERAVAKWQREKLGIVDKNITKDEIYENFINSDWTEDDLLISLLKRRKEVYNSIVAKSPSKSVFIKGWLNRVNKFCMTFCSAYVQDSLNIHSSY